MSMRPHLPFYKPAFCALAALMLSSGVGTAHASSFAQINLVSNIPGLAAKTDPNLVNPWGVSFLPTSPFWVSDQKTGVATLYDGAGTVNPLVVTIPGSATGPSGPTGQVANSGTGFVVTGTTTPAHFIFANLNGTISAWASGTTATVEATTPGAVYTGLAIANNTLFAANSSQGRVDVFNSSFAPTTVPGGFSDPNIPAGFVPFNVQVIGSTVYVMYAHLQGATPLPGGFVDAYDTNGNLLSRVASNGPLSAPWGITLAPTGFGDFGNDLLIGNFGDGTIDAYTLAGLFVGAITGSNGLPLVNDHLWALDFRTGGPNVNTGALYLTAGINNETAGLFAEIVPTAEPASLLLAASGLLGGLAAKLRRSRARS